MQSVLNLNILNYYIKFIKILIFHSNINTKLLKKEIANSVIKLIRQDKKIINLKFYIINNKQLIIIFSK